MNRFPPRRILIASDLAPSSLAALGAGRDLAARWGSAVELVHVQHPPVLAGWVGPDSMPASVPSATVEPRRRIELRLRRAAEGIDPAKLKLRMIHGPPPSALMELARPERADLLVMGTHGLAGLDRLLTGSVAEVVLRRARIPVLVVPEKAALPAGGRVLAPWNGRPYATRALRWAREFARGLGSMLDVLYVDENEHPLDRDAALCRRLLAALGTGTDWMLHKRQGDARARIVAEANSGRYAVVVLSAHRRAFASDFIFGCTVERVLRHSAVPVLAVPSGRSWAGAALSLGARAGGRLY